MSQWKYRGFFNTKKQLTKKIKKESPMVRRYKIIAIRGSHANKRGFMLWEWSRFVTGVSILLEKNREEFNYKSDLIAMITHINQWEKDYERPYIVETGRFHVPYVILSDPEVEWLEDARR